MTDRTLTRRQFLQGTTRIGLTLTLATALGPSPRQYWLIIPLKS